MNKKNKRAPIHITKADVKRARKKVAEFQRLLERGKTKKQILEDLLRLIQVGE